MIIGFILKLKRAYDYIEDADIALTREYSRGINDATCKVKSQLGTALDTISKVSHEAMETSKNLSEGFRASLTDEENRWQSKCKMCKQSVDAERYKLRSIQDSLREALNQFSEIYGKLFKHASFVDSAHDTILNSTAQVKASKNILEKIGDEYDSFKDRIHPILNISIEDNYAEKGERPAGGRNKPGVETSNDGRVVNSSSLRTKTGETV